MFKKVVAGAVARKLGAGDNEGLTEADRAADATLDATGKAAYGSAKYGGKAAKVGGKAGWKVGKGAASVTGKFAKNVVASEEGRQVVAKVAVSSMEAYAKGSQEGNASAGGIASHVVGEMMNDETGRRVIAGAAGATADDYWNKRTGGTGSTAFGQAVGTAVESTMASDAGRQAIVEATRVGADAAWDGGKFAAKEASKQDWGQIATTAYSTYDQASGGRQSGSSRKEDRNRSRNAPGRYDVPTSGRYDVPGDSSYSSYSRGDRSNYRSDMGRQKEPSERQSQSRNYGNSEPRRRYNPGHNTSTNAGYSTGSNTGYAGSRDRTGPPKAPPSRRKITYPDIEPERPKEKKKGWFW